MRKWFIPGWNTDTDFGALCQWASTQQVAGDTIYNMLKLEDGDVDDDDRPEYPQKIKTVEVVDNPFPDIVPREKQVDESETVKKPKKETSKK